MLFGRIVRCILSTRVATRKPTIRVYAGSIMETKKITFKSENPTGDGVGVLIGNPSSCTRGLVVVHEWWGMTQQIQDEGVMIARDGQMTVLVCDVYRGKIAIDHEQAGHYMQDLDWDGAVKDISAAAKYLMNAGCNKVGVTGFCMGGALSFRAAARCPEIHAAAPFYGIPRDKAELETIRIPVQAHFGEKDEVVGFSSPADYGPLTEKLKAANVPYEVFTYPAGHGFTNPNNPNYSADCTALAFGRMYEFMKKHLNSKL